MHLKLRAEVGYAGERLSLRVTEARIEGDWRILGYAGAFRLTRGELEVRVSARTLVKGVAGVRGRLGGLEDLLKLLASATGKHVVVRGPLGVKLAEAEP